MPSAWKGIAYVGEKKVAEATVTCQLVDRSRGRRIGRRERRSLSRSRSISFRSCAPNERPSHSHHRSTGEGPLPSCKIGPYCVIGAEVELGEGCHLVSHVAIEGPTKIGERQRFLSLSRRSAWRPQDLSYRGRAHAAGNRRPQRDPRVRDHQPRHGEGRRAHARSAATC